MAFQFNWTEIDRMFRNFHKNDLDHNGELDTQELLGLLREEVSSATAEDAKWFLGMVDWDQSGTVSFPEYLKGVAEFGKKGRKEQTKESRTFNWQEAAYMHDVFTGNDDKNKRMLNFSQLHAALQELNSKISKKAVSDLVRRVGAAQSEYVTFGEFVKGVAYSDVEFKLPSGWAAERQVSNRSRSASKGDKGGGSRSRSRSRESRSRSKERGYEKSPNAGRRIRPTSSNLSDKKHGTEDVAQMIRKMTDETSAAIMLAFNAVDRNHNGSLSSDELLAALAQLDPSAPKAELNRLYSEIDRDHSGNVSFAEFQEGVLKYGWDLDNLKKVGGAGAAQAVEGWEIPSKELQLGSKLGEGAYGVVHRGRWRGTVCAVKTMHKNIPPEAMEEFRREIDIMAKIRHPNAVLFLGASTAPDATLTLVTEYMEGGSLFDALHTRKKRFDIKTVLSMSLQVARGMAYMHPIPIVHRDLKSLNLLVDDNWNMKICDFGLSVLGSNKLSEQVGTPHWMAPELLLGKNYDETVDVYSFGLCVYEMLSGKVPFADYDHATITAKVARGNERPAIPPNTPEPLSRLIQTCWNDSPVRRPHFEVVITSLEKIQKGI